MYTNEDIEVFILTYNRANFLKDSIQSILNQTIKDIKITVMDNGSTDNTEDVVKEFQEQTPQIHYYKQNTNISFFDNAKKAVELATKKYMMLFHDDDIVHPDYLKLCLSAINKYKNVAIVSTLCTATTNPTLDNWGTADSKLHLTKSRKEFATYLYRIGGFCFPSTIYKTENLKEVVKNKIDSFGKISDMPLILKSVFENDNAVIFRNTNLFKYRIHAGQDTNATANGPYYNEIIAYNHLFKKELDYSAYSRFMYDLVLYKRLKSLYKMGHDYTLSFHDFVKSANKEGLDTTLCKLSNNRVTEPFIKPLTSILRKIFKPHYKSATLKVPHEKIIACCSTCDDGNNNFFYDFKAARDSFGALVYYYIAKMLPNHTVISGDIAYEMYKSKKVKPKDILIVTEQLSNETKELLREGAIGVYANCYECIMYSRSYYIRLKYWMKKFKHSVLYKGAYKMFKPQKSLDTQIAYFPAYDQSEIVDPVPVNERDFMVMIMSNKFYNHKKLRKYRKMLIENELQHTRLRLIEFFAKNKALKLCGPKWDDLSNLPKEWQNRLGSLVKELDPKPVDYKIDVIKNYKFNLCVENMQFEGYVTEKLIHALVAGAIPVYIGANDIEDFVPKNCFIHIRDFDSYEKLLDYMKNLTDEELNRYIQNGQDFLRSEQGRRFDCKVIADKIVANIKKELY